MGRRGGWGRAAVLLGVLAVELGAGAPRSADAQGLAPRRARRVALRLVPRAGDTVRTRFEQTVRVSPRDPLSPTGPVEPASAMLVIARSIVERVDGGGAVVLAVTDSVAFRAAGAPPAVVERMRRGMQGRRAQLHVAPDGALDARQGTAGSLGASGEDATTALRLPGTLPTADVAPGATWRRAMAVPSWGTAGAPPHLDVSFRFDSMPAGGDRAYISLRGRVHDDATGGEDGSDGRGAGAESGRVDGGLVVDLVRGWVVESWATFQLDAVMVSAPGAVPTPVRVVVTQRLRAY